MTTKEKRTARQIEEVFQFALCAVIAVVCVWAIVENVQRHNAEEREITEQIETWYKYAGKGGDW